MIAVRQTLNVSWLALAIVAYAGVLELSQLLIPSRVASVEDFAASAMGAIVAMPITALALRGVGKAIKSRRNSAG